MKNTARALVRVVGGFGASLCLLVGVPALLITIAGNPLPSSVPAIDELVETLTKNGAGFSEFVLGGLAILLWLIWLQLVVAFLVEVIATIRRRQTSALPTLPGIQGVAARLVASMTLATTLAGAPVLAPAVGALSFDPIEPIEQLLPPPVEAPLLDPVPAATVRTGNRVESESATTLVVAQATDLWDLADAVYGDGVAWKQIAIANAGRIAANGTTITSDTEVVPAQTELLLRAVPDQASATSFGTVALGAPSLHIVEPGDSMWSVAEDVIELRSGTDASTNDIAPYWREVIRANQGRVLSGDIDLIHPGEELVLPGESGGEVIAPAVVGAAEVDVAELLLDDPDPESVERESVASEAVLDPPKVLVEELQPAPLSPPTSVEPLPQRAPRPSGLPSTQTPSRGAAPAAVVVERRLPIAPAGLAAFGTALLAVGVVGALRRRRDVQRRQRPAGQRIKQPSTQAATFDTALVHAAGSVIESKHNGGWRILPANVLSVEGETEPEQAVVDQHQSATIVVGTDIASGDALLLDLTQAGSVEVQGDASSVRGFVRTAMLDLAVSQNASDLCIIGVDVGRELGDLERIRVTSTFADALAETVRCGHAHESQTPIVVVAADAPPDDDVAVGALRELGAVLLAPGIDAEVRVAINGDRASVWPDGSTVILSAFPAEDYAATAELIDCSALGSTEAPAGTFDDSASPACPIEQGPVEVQILGPVTVAGAAPFSSLKATDVLAYLAFHRNGADADQIKSWVWPPFDPPSDKAFANVISRARTGLGANESGDPYVSRAGSDKTYRLADEVTTDFDRFQGLIGLADNTDDDQRKLALFQQAVELIRGVPFSGGSASSFAWADNHVRAHVDFTIDEAVHRCADLALRLGELQIARWAVMKGLELVPGCEQCFRRRFLVASAGSNRTELRRAMIDLERSATAELGEPEAIDSISHELIELYEQLDGELVRGAS